MAINLLEQLSNKDNTLAKKSEQLGVPKPTSVPLAQSLNIPDKAAQMAASPQAKQAEQKKTSEQQLDQRKAEVAAQAPREVAEAPGYVGKAQELINNAKVSREQVQAAQAGIVAGTDTTVAGLTEEEALSNLQTGAAAPTADFSAVEDVSALNITLADLNDPDLVAYATNAGLDPNTMTLGQFQEFVDNEVNQITAIVDDARNILNDPNQPPAVRQQARQEMIDYGAAHLIATDAELDAFKDDIKTATVLRIGGTDYTLEDLEDNPAIAASLLSAAEQISTNPNLTAEDVDLPPALFQFVQKHVNSILSTLSADKATLETVKSKVDTNKKFTDNMSADLKDALGITEFSTADLSEGMPGLTVFSTTFNPTEEGYTGQQVREGLEVLGKTNPEALKAFLSDPKFMDKLPQLMQQSKNIDVVQKAQSPADLISLVGTDFKDFMAKMNDMRLHPNQYSAEQKAFMKLFDADGNNSMDSMSAVKDRLLNWLKDPNNKAPSFSGPTFASKIVDNYRNIVKDTGVDLDNLQDMYKASSAESAAYDTNLQKVNRAISKLDDVVKKYPENKQLQDLYRQLQGARTTLVSIVRPKDRNRIVPVDVKEATRVWRENKKEQATYDFLSKNVLDSLKSIDKNSEQAVRMTPYKSSAGSRNAVSFFIEQANRIIDSNMTVDQKIKALQPIKDMIEQTK